MLRVDQDELNDFLAEIDFELLEVQRAELDRILYGTGYFNVSTGRRVKPERMGHGRQVICNPKLPSVIERRASAIEIVSARPFDLPRWNCLTPVYLDEINP